MSVSTYEKRTYSIISIGIWLRFLMKQLLEFSWLNSIIPFGSRLNMRRCLGVYIQILTESKIFAARVFNLFKYLY